MIREYYELRLRFLRTRFFLKTLLVLILAGTIVFFTAGIIGTHNSTKPQTQATMAEKKANKVLAHQLATAGWNWKGRQIVCIDKLFTRESRYDHLAKNKRSTAFGIGQLLNETSKTPAVQLTRAFGYIKFRYGTPCRAYSFHIRKGYY